MAARKYKGAWWVDFHWIQQGGPKHGLRIRIRKRSRIDTKRGAEDFERLLRDKLQAGESLNAQEPSPAPVITTYEEFAADWLRTYVATNTKPSTQERYEQILRSYLLPFFGDTELAAITTHRIETFKAQSLEDGLARKTVNSMLSVLRCSLNTAIEWEKLSHLPRFQWLKLEPPAFDFLTREESERLLNATLPEDRPILTTALRTGLRLGELRALRWEDVDFHSMKIFVRRNAWRNIVGSPKSGKFREVPLSPEVGAVLRAHKHLKGELVFSKLDGAMLTKDDLRNILPRTCKRAGLRVVGWHDLRHSFASQLVIAGVPLKAVQELLGHAMIEMTMRYAHLSPSVHVDAVARLDKSNHKSENPPWAPNGHRDGFSGMLSS